MHIETIALKGNHEWYEDETIINEQLSLYGVIDGATSLDAYRGSQGETGAYLAAQIVKKVFEDELDTTLSLKMLAIKANTQLRDEMSKVGIDTDNAASLWSCALACIKIFEHSIEYVQAADCMIVAKYNDGSIRVITRDQVSAIGQQSLQHYEKIRADGHFSHSEAVAMIKPMLAENRYRGNKSDGYTVLNGQHELAYYLEYGTISRNGLVSIYIFSDGLFLPTVYFESEAEQWEKTIELIDKLSLAGYSHWLLEEERADVECIKYKRLKISDDKTAIKISF